MILSYSPFQSDLGEDLKASPVLVVGDPAAKVMAVAASYGFRRAMHVSAYATANPTMNPFKTYPSSSSSSSSGGIGDNFAAICVFTDPSDFFEALQVCTDVLLSGSPQTVEVQGDGRRIPCFFSNPDLLWKDAHPFSRFGQGAFRLCLEACLAARLGALGSGDESGGGSGSYLEHFFQYGKPEVSQMEHALRALQAQHKKSGGAAEITDVYMVGDNPASDMQGPLNMQVKAARSGCGEGGSPQWHGVLVRTGVFSEGQSPNGALLVENGVAGAVDAILARHDAASFPTK